MLQKLDLRLFGLRFISVVIGLMGLMSIVVFILLGAIFTSLNPKVHVDGTSFIRVLMASYEMTSEGVRARFGWQNDLLVSYVVIVSLLGSILYVFCGVFLFLRKSWARKVIILFSIYVLLNSLIIRVFTRTFTVDFNTVYFFILNIALLSYFANKSIIALFNPHQRLNLSKQDN